MKLKTPSGEVEVLARVKNNVSTYLATSIPQQTEYDIRFTGINLSLVTDSKTEIEPSTIWLMGNVAVEWL